MSSINFKLYYEDMLPHWLKKPHITTKQFAIFVSKKGLGNNHARAVARASQRYAAAKRAAARARVGR